jgi:hypothetical protein
MIDKFSLITPVLTDISTGYQYFAVLPEEIILSSGKKREDSGSLDGFRVLGELAK